VAVGGRGRQLDAVRRVRAVPAASPVAADHAEIFEVREVALEGPLRDRPGFGHGPDRLPDEALVAVERVGNRDER
jgi:hypothetical protein